MILKEKIKKIPFILNFAAIIIVLIHVAIYFQIPKENSNSKDFRGIEYTIEKAQIYYDEVAKAEELNLPKVLLTKKPFEVSFDLSKVENLSEKTFAIYAGYSDIKFIMDKKVFYEIKADTDTSFYAGGGYTYYLIDFPKDIKIPKLNIQYTPQLKIAVASNYDIYPLYIGNRVNFVIENIYKDWLGIALSIILFFVFFISTLVVVVFKKAQKKENVISNENIINLERLYNVGLISLIIAVYNFSAGFVSIRYIFGEYKYALHLLEYLSFSFLVLPIVKIVRGYLDIKFDKFLAMNINLIYINFTIQTIFSLSGFLAFKEMLRITQFLHAFTFINVLIAMAFTNSKKYPDKKSLVFSILPFFINFVIGYAFYLLTFQIAPSFVLLFNMLIFVCVQVYFLSKKYMII